MESNTYKIIELIKEFTNANIEINEDTRLDELGIDSFGFIKFVISLEKEFGIKIPDEKLDMSEFQSISDITKMITELSS